MTFEYQNFEEVVRQFELEKNTYLTQCGKNSFEDLGDDRRRNEWTLLEKALSEMGAHRELLLKNGEELPLESVTALQAQAATGLIALLMNQLSSTFWSVASTRTNISLSKIAGFSFEAQPELLQKLEMLKAVERFMDGFVLNKDTKEFHVNTLTKAFPEKGALGAYVKEFNKAYAKVRTAVGVELVDAAIESSKPAADNSSGYGFIGRLWSTGANAPHSAEKKEEQEAKEACAPK